jgi:Fe-S cluster biogenesis protein NfuA
MYNLKVSVCSGAVAESIMVIENCLDRDLIEIKLDRIRHALEVDGSGLELLALDDGTATVALSGRVVENYSSAMLLKIGIERALRQEVPGFGELFAKTTAGESIGS